MSAKPEAKDDAAPKKGKGKLLVIIIAAVVLLAGGGGAAWWFTRPKPEGDEAAEKAPAKHAPKKAADRVFKPLDPFTVNLADEGGDRMAQIAVVMELESKESEDLVAKNMPIVRNSILMLISSLESKELLTVAGKQHLSDQIAVAAGTAIGWEEADPEEPDPEEEDGAAEPAKGKEVKGKEVKGKDAKKKKRRRPARRAEPNPVVAVHFGQFIIQ